MESGDPDSSPSAEGAWHQPRATLEAGPTGSSRGWAGGRRRWPQADSPGLGPRPPWALEWDWAVQTRPHCLANPSVPTVLVFLVCGSGMGLPDEILGTQLDLSHG